VGGCRGDQRRGRTVRARPIRAWPTARRPGRAPGTRAVPAPRSGFGSGPTGGGTWSKKPPHSSYVMTKTVRAQFGLDTTALYTLPRNAWPSRMSASGCSSSARPGTALVRVVRVVEAAPVRDGQVVRLVRDAVAVEEGQPGLLAVGAGQPAEAVVERAVLHHHDDDVVDAGVRGTGHGGCRRGPGGQGYPRRSGGRDRHRAGEEFTPGYIAHAGSSCRILGHGLTFTDQGDLSMRNRRPDRHGQANLESALVDPGVSTCRWRGAGTVDTHRPHSVASVRRLVLGIAQVGASPWQMLTVVRF
jgi:hypothetical protein